MQYQLPINRVPRSIGVAGILACVVVVGAAIHAHSERLTAIRADEAPVIVVPGSARTVQAGHDSSPASRESVTVDRPPQPDFSDAKTRVVGLTESRMPPGWGVTSALHDRFKGQPRDAEWATTTEGTLMSWRAAIGSSAASRLASSDVYCAASICEMVILPPKDSGFTEVNEVADHFQESGFSDYLSKNGLTLSAVTTGNSSAGVPGITMYLEKRI